MSSEIDRNTNEVVNIPRDRAAALGREAVVIAADGRYRTAAGGEVDLADAVADAVAGTSIHGPEVRTAAPGSHATRTWAAPVSTLAAARDLVRAGHRVAALNFASAKKPGGGFLNGARAQEESLCRSSALYPCLEHQAIYGDEQRRGGGMYTTWVVYSPDVPVFRGDDGELLDAWYPVSFLTSPAVNAAVVLEREPGRDDEIRRVMAERVACVLDVAARHGHPALVLGAWGCGVFGNDPEVIADLFAGALAARPGTFAEVGFAVLDSRPGRPLLAPFVERFGSLA